MDAKSVIKRVNKNIDTEHTRLICVLNDAIAATKQISTNNGQGTIVTANFRFVEKIEARHIKYVTKYYQKLGWDSVTLHQVMIKLQLKDK